MTHRRRIQVLVKRSLRDAAFSMRQIADKAGVSYGSVRQWKAGDRVPEPASRLRLARAFRRHARRLEELAEELETSAREEE